MKLYRQNVSLLFNQTCLNERLLPNYTHTHTNLFTLTNENAVFLNKNYFGTKTFRNS